MDDESALSRNTKDSIASTRVRATEVLVVVRDPVGRPRLEVRAWRYLAVILAGVVDTE